MHYDIKDDKLADWRDAQYKTIPLMRYSDSRKPCVEQKTRYTFIVAVCHKPSWDVKLLVLSNSEIRDKWHKIVKEHGLVKWCYYDDLNIALRPDADELNPKPNQNGNPDKCLERLYGNLINTFFGD